MYSIFGLSLHSVIPLPELITSCSSPDVRLTFGRIAFSPTLPHSAYYHYTESQEGAYLVWRDVGTFFIRGGREIVVDPQAGAEESRIRLVLLGAVFSIILQQRGYLVFHASALSLQGRGVMFVGDKGWGKSTMAAALHRRGHTFLADDVVAVDDSENGSEIVPAFPQIKLWSDAITAMGENPGNFPQVSILVDKREHRLTQGFLNKRVPISSIYILGLSEDVVPEIQAMKPREALMYLIAHTYSARWGKEMFAQNSASHLIRCSRLVNGIPVYRLLRPKSLELMPTIAEMIEQHLRS